MDIKRVRRVGEKILIHGGGESTWLDAQNSEPALIARGASDYYWGSVQTLRWYELLGVVICPIVLALVKIYRSEWADLADTGVLFLLLVDGIYWYPEILERRKLAAQAQDIFDAIAFHVARSPLRRSNDPEQSALRSAAARQKTSRQVGNRNWYTPILGQLPCDVGRIACMRESAVWDGGQRKNYLGFIKWSSCMLIVGLVCLGVSYHLTILESLARTSVSLTPLVVWVMREYVEQKESVSTVEGLRSALQQSWEWRAKNLQAEELDTEAYDYMTAFYAYRSTTSPIPHFRYLQFRKSNASIMKQSAQDLVEQYRRQDT